MPRAAALLPERLSASAVEALRECPYRFFALRLLHLQEPEELDASDRAARLRHLAARGAAPLS